MYIYIYVYIYIYIYTLHTYMYTPVVNTFGEHKGPRVVSGFAFALSFSRLDKRQQYLRPVTVVQIGQEPARHIIYPYKSFSTKKPMNLILYTEGDLSVPILCLARQFAERHTPRPLTPKP